MTQVRLKINTRKKQPLIYKSPVPFLFAESELEKTKRLYTKSGILSAVATLEFAFLSRRLPPAQQNDIKAVFAMFIEKERERNGKIGGPLECAASLAGLLRQSFFKFGLAVPDEHLPETGRARGMEAFLFTWKDILRDAGKLFGRKDPETAVRRVFRWLYYYWLYLKDKRRFSVFYSSLAPQEKAVYDDLSTFWNSDEEVVVDALLSGVLTALVTFVDFLDKVPGAKHMREAASYHVLRANYEFWSDEVLANDLTNYGNLEALYRSGFILDALVDEWIHYPLGEEERKIVEETGPIYHFLTARPYVEAYRKKYTKRR